MAVGLIIMKDLNSLSKEELIKLVALQQERSELPKKGPRKSGLSRKKPRGQLKSKSSQI